MCSNDLSKLSTGSRRRRYNIQWVSGCDVAKTNAEGAETETGVRSWTDLTAGGLR